MIRVKCTCGSRFQAEDRHAGKRTECPQCGKVLCIPGERASGTSSSAKLRRMQTHTDTVAERQAAAARDTRPPQPVAGKVPSVVGQYQLIRKLGQGAMGEVWLGHDPALERDVAIKVIPEEMAGNEERRQRFLREAKLAARLNHTNAVTVYQAIVKDDRVFVVMELVDGDSLEAIVNSGGCLNWEDASRVVCDAARGLAAAHELGLVHRDIKPENLMRTSRGVTKVVDFGLAREQLQDTKLTRQGMLVGTPAYMAPEQWTAGRVDGRTDLYSLACVYYYLLTGQAPFAADSIPALAYQHRCQPLPDPRSAAPGIPDAACRILARAAQKDPDDRFENAGRMADALDALLATPDESHSFDAPWSQIGAESSREAGDVEDPRRPGLLGGLIQPVVQQGKKRPVVVSLAAGGIVALACLLPLLLFGGKAAGERQGEVASRPGSGAPPARAASPQGTTGTAAASPSASTPPRRRQVEAAPAPPEQERPKALAAAPAKPQFDDTDLEHFVQAAPVWRAVDPAEIRRIRDARKQLLENTKKHKYEVGELLAKLLAPRDPDPASLAPGSADAKKLADLFNALANEVEGNATKTRTFQDVNMKVMEAARTMRTDNFEDFATKYRKELENLADELAATVGRLDRPVRMSDDERKKLVAWFRAKAEDLDDELPPVFQLEGELGAVRVFSGGTMVYLWSPNAVQAINPAGNAGNGLPIPRIVCIQFPSSVGPAQLIDLMADYRVGDKVRVVAQRKAWGDFLVAPNRGGGNNDPNVERARQFVPLCRWFGPGPLYLTFDGKGIEKPDQAKTWIDATAGREVQLENVDSARLWPGIVNRNVPRFQDTKGIVTASYVAVSKKDEESDLLVQMRISDSLEGPIEVIANMGGVPQAEEFLDYNEGDTVLAAVQLGVGRIAPFGQSSGRSPIQGYLRSFPTGGWGGGFDSGGTPIMRRARPSYPADPLMARAAIAAECTRINKQGDPDSLVTSVGPRREEVEVGAIDPAKALVNPAGVVGKEVQWTGELSEIKQRNGETHLVISGRAPTAGTFEAYTPDAAFVEQLADYVADTEDGDAADEVTVWGTLASDTDADVRLSRSAPLVNLREVRRGNRPESLAVVGKARAASTIDQLRMAKELRAMLRVAPMPGREVRFTASFRSYTSYSKYIYVTSGPNDSRYVKVTFADPAVEATLKSLKSGAVVEIVAVVRNNGAATSTLEFEGTSIRVVTPTPSSS